MAGHTVAAPYCSFIIILPVTASLHLLHFAIDHKSFLSLTDVSISYELFAIVKTHNMPTLGDSTSPIISIVAVTPEVRSTSMFLFPISTFLISSTSFVITQVYKIKSNVLHDLQVGQDVFKLFRFLKTQMQTLLVRLVLKVFENICPCPGVIVLIDAINELRGWLLEVSVFKIWLQIV